MKNFNLINKILFNKNLLIIFLLILFTKTSFAADAQLKVINNTKDLYLKIDPEVSGVKAKKVAPGKDITFNFPGNAPDTKPRVEMYSDSKMLLENFIGFAGSATKVRVDMGKTTLIKYTGDSENGLDRFVSEPGNENKEAENEIKAREKEKEENKAENIAKKFADDLDNTTHRLINRTDKTVAVWITFSHLKTMGIMAAEELATYLTFGAIGAGIQAARVAAKTAAQKGATVTLRQAIKTGIKESGQWLVKKSVIGKGVQKVATSASKTRLKNSLVKTLGYKTVKQLDDDIATKSINLTTNATKNLQEKMGLEAFEKLGKEAQEKLIYEEAQKMALKELSERAIKIKQGELIEQLIKNVPAKNGQEVASWFGKNNLKHLEDALKNSNIDDLLNGLKTSESAKLTGINSLDTILEIQTKNNFTLAKAIAPIRTQILILEISSNQPAIGLKLFTKEIINIMTSKMKSLYQTSAAKLTNIPSKLKTRWQNLFKQKVQTRMATLTEDMNLDNYFDNFLKVTGEISDDVATKTTKTVDDDVAKIFDDLANDPKFIKTQQELMKENDDLVLELNKATQLKEKSEKFFDDSLKKKEELTKLEKDLPQNIDSLEKATDPQQIKELKTTIETNKNKIESLKQEISANEAGSKLNNDNISAYNRQIEQIEKLSKETSSKIKANLRSKLEINIVDESTIDDFLNKIRILESPDNKLTNQSLIFNRNNIGKEILEKKWYKVDTESFVGKKIDDRIGKFVKDINASGKTSKEYNQLYDDILKQEKEYLKINNFDEWLRSTGTSKDKLSQTELVAKEIIYNKEVAPIANTIKRFENAKSKILKYVDDCYKFNTRLKNIRDLYKKTTDLLQSIKKLSFSKNTKKASTFLDNSISKVNQLPKTSKVKALITRLTNLKSSISRESIEKALISTRNSYAIITGLLIQNQLQADLIELQIKACAAQLISNPNNEELLTTLNKLYDNQDKLDKEYAENTEAESLTLVENDILETTLDINAEESGEAIPELASPVLTADNQKSYARGLVLPGNEIDLNITDYPMPLAAADGFVDRYVMPSNALTAYSNATGGGYHALLMPGQIIWVNGGADIHNMFVGIWDGQNDEGYIGYYKNFDIYDKNLSKKIKIDNLINIPNKTANKWVDIYFAIDKANNKIIVKATEQYDKPTLKQAKEYANIK